MSTSGEDLYFAPQAGDIDPQRELENHLHMNTLSPMAAFFSWCHPNGLCPLTHSEFTRCIDGASSRLGMEPLKGHGTLEYLLCGVSFETVKAMGHWSGDAFLRYLRQHTVVMAPYLLNTPILEPFTYYAMPPVC